jgi:uncharacterized membrane protein YjjP (DUF1212 family)
MWKRLFDRLIGHAAVPATPTPADASAREAARLRDAIAFIERLARAMHRYGYAAPNIEDALTLVARRLGIRAEFFATPTAIFASAEHDSELVTRLIRVSPGDVDLDKLSRVDRLIHMVAERRLSPAAGIRELDAIVAAPRRYRGWQVVIAFAVASATSARFFGGGWREALACAVIGSCSGTLAWIAGRAPRFRVFEPTAAFVAGVCASAAAAVLPPTSLYVAMCGGLIVLLPGLTLTIAISELAQRHLASGTARLMAAATLFMTIGFGVAVGLKLGGALFGHPPMSTAPVPLPDWTLALAILASPLALVVIFQANERDAGWIVLVCVIAFLAARLGAVALGIETGAFAGALAVGVASGLHSLRFNRPALLTAVPGIIMLVPGSVGFRSIADMIADDPVSGLHTAFSMLLTGVAIVAGILVARSIVPSRRWTSSTMSDAL